MSLTKKTLTSAAWAFSSGYTNILIAFVGNLLLARILLPEDFGVFGWDAKAAMLCLGPGEDYAALHNPDFDFPDDLIPIGCAIFERIARDLLGTA